MLGLILCAFDGTGNDGLKDRWDTGKTPTNVRVMWDLYKGEKIYKWGVGTRTDISSGLLFGNGTGTRVSDTVSLLAGYLAHHPTEPVDIIGFSRGAASARIFANRLSKELPCANIRFLGLFDTVAQIGLPNWVNYQFGYDLDVNPNVIGFTAHAVAENEYRSLFPLTSISATYSPVGIDLFLLGPNDYLPGEFKEIRGANYWEKPFPGNHSEIGGGYDSRKIDALKWMIAQGQAAGAPFADLTSFPHKILPLPGANAHDSRYPFLDVLPGTDFGRHSRVIYSSGNIR